MTYIHRKIARTERCVRWFILGIAMRRPEIYAHWGRVDVASCATAVINAPNAPKAYRAADTIWR